MEQGGISQDTSKGGVVVVLRLKFFVCSSGSRTRGLEGSQKGVICNAVKRVRVQLLRYATSRFIIILPPHQRMLPDLCNWAVAE